MATTKKLEATKVENPDVVWGNITFTVKSIDGEEIQVLKKLNLKKELVIRNLIAGKLSALFQNQNVPTDEIKAADPDGAALPDGTFQERAFLFVFRDFVELLVPIVAVIIKKDNDWVAENLERSTAEEIARPFLKGFFEVPMMDILQTILPSGELEK